MVMIAESDHKQVFFFCFHWFIANYTKEHPIEWLIPLLPKQSWDEKCLCLLAVRKADFCNHVAISCILSWEFTDSYLQGTETTL